VSPNRRKVQPVRAILFLVRNTLYLDPPHPFRPCAAGPDHDLTKRVMFSASTAVYEHCLNPTHFFLWPRLYMCLTPAAPAPRLQSFPSIGVSSFYANQNPAHLKTQRLRIALKTKASHHPFSVFHELLSRILHHRFVSSSSISRCGGWRSEESY
jgi:hypothetical protein